MKDNSKDSFFEAKRAKDNLFNTRFIVKFYEDGQLINQFVKPGNPGNHFLEIDINTLKKKYFAYMGMNEHLEQGNAIRIQQDFYNTAICEILEGCGEQL